MAEQPKQDEPGPERVATDADPRESTPPDRAGQGDDAEAPSARDAGIRETAGGATAGGDAVAVAGRAARVAGRALARSGKWVGRKLADAYLAVDPDVRRHVGHAPLLVYTLFGSKHQPIDETPSDGHPPLIFVHGLGGSRGDFLLMAQYLRLHGRKRSYRIHFGGGQSIEQMAEALAGFVRDVVRVTGEPKAQIVAHSLGGVVTRLAMVDHQIAPLLDTVITLGSPHAGTYPARYAATKLTLVLRPDSPVVRRLADCPWPSEVRGISCWSQSDVMILPAESAALPGTRQLEVTPFSHISYLVDPRAWLLVKRELQGA